VEVQSAAHEFEDLSKASLEIDELWGALNEFMERGKTLNKRRRIFNHPEIEMERLAVLIERLRHRHALLTMVSTFIRSRDEWTLAPLSSVDINSIKKEVKRCENVLQDSRLHFASQAEIMLLIERISSVVRDFSEAVRVMEALSNSNFQLTHWAVLSERTGGAFKFKPAIAFSSLLEHGILAHSDIVFEVSMEATRERKVREQEELEAHQKWLVDDELLRQKKIRLAARKHIFDWPVHKR
jgi:Dynein heavy chain, N-terminal region 2